MASIDKRANGQYRARWREYPGGPQRTKQFARKVDAEAHLVKVQHDLLTGTYVTPEAAQVTLDAYIKAHLARQPWRSSTGDVAANALTRHVIGHFGKDRPISSIRKSDVQAFIGGLALAPSTVKVVHQHLSGLLASAVEDRLLMVNPAKGVKLPRSSAGEIVPPTSEDVTKLYVAAPTWFRKAVVMGAGLGLRQAEASGLTGDRIDWLADRTVRIDRQWVSRRLPHQFAPPKSDSSYRTIPAADDILAELGAGMRDRSGFVVNRDGAPVGHHPFEHAWRQTVKKAGLEPGLRFHDLRHRFASVLISKGCSVVAVQRAMGHSSAAITLNLYGHLMPSDSDMIRSAMTGQFGASEDQVRTDATSG